MFVTTVRALRRMFRVTLLLVDGGPRCAGAKTGAYQSPAMQWRP